MSGPQVCEGDSRTGLKLHRERRQVWHQKAKERRPSWTEGESYQKEVISYFIGSTLAQYSIFFLLEFHFSIEFLVADLPGERPCPSSS